MSQPSWWRRFRERAQAFRRLMHASSLLGQAFKLRDSGRLDEALDACQRALAAATDANAVAPDGASFSTLVVGATTLDELACALQKPDVARPALERALAALESMKRQGLTPIHPGSNASLLADTERTIRRRLAVLRING